MTGLILEALYLGQNRTCFRVWAPRSKRIDLHLLASPGDRLVRLRPDRRGYHAAEVRGVAPGDRYRFRLDGGLERPDPASRLQPLGVHGPSEVVDPAFEWSDRSWTGSRLRDYRFYQTLLRIRGDYAALAEAERDSYDVTALPGSRVLMVHYRHPEPGLLLLLAFGSRRGRAKVPLPPGIWRKRHDSADRKWRGPGSAVAARLHAAGEVRLTLNRRSALLFGRTH